MKVRAIMVTYIFKNSRVLPCAHLGFINFWCETWCEKTANRDRRNMKRFHRGYGHKRL